MAGGGAWSRRVAVRQRTLRGLVRDTQRAAHDVSDILHIDPEISAAVQEIGNHASRSTALVILGTSSAARARLLHCLLGRQLLPNPLPRGCRWLRIQYGSNTAAHLTLGGSEFELVDELRCNQKPWDTIPVEDLIRQDQTDLATMLEIELNNQFLKDGLKIIIPPDIGSEPGDTNYAALKQIHSELYYKREHILKNFNPVYLYAIDKIGRSIFSENITYDSQFGSSKSEEEFRTMFNLYYMAGVNVGREEESKEENLEERRSLSQQWKESSAEPSVFSSENCLDLHQIKEINPKSQVLFILFSNSTKMREDRKREEEEERKEERVRLPLEATESEETELFRTEDLPESDQGCFKDVILGNRVEPPDKSKDDRRLQEEQIAFMNDLLDQWEVMSSPPQKHYVKSQWTIVNDVEIMRTAENKALASYLSNAVQNASETLAKGCKREDDRRVASRSTLLNQVVKFAAECCHSYLLEYSTRLSEIHVKLLQQLVLASFDLARELQLVPKKIQYVATHEQHLYETIIKKFSEGEKKQELLNIMQEVLTEIRSEINNMDWSVDDLLCHQDRRFMISNSVFYSSTQSSPEQVSLPLNRNRNHPDRPTGSSTCQKDGSTCQPDGSTCQADGSTCQIDDSTCQPADQTPSDGEEAVSYDSYNFDDYEIITSTDESISAGSFMNKSRTEEASSLPSAVHAIRVENETEMFSMSSSLFRSRLSDSVSTAATTCTNAGHISVKQASLDVQQKVLSQLSRKISLKLVKFVDCLKDTYFGTLQRCLESLEACCLSELSGRPASGAMRALWAAARAVDLQPCASYSVLRELLHSLRRLFHRLRIVGGASEEACCVLSPVWRRRVAAHTAAQLTPQRLAAVISQQIVERVSACHGGFQSALGALQGALGPRLHHSEDTRRAIRKKYAPSFARLCLESTSMCDLLMYGTPELGREIGRGQYGVVYSVRGAWGAAGAGGAGGAAVKSVLPADERHYHELAMEFFYTRSIPPHPRIVRLLGSVVQRHGSGGGAPCVLLVSERRTRDLHAAVRAGLSFCQRMQISVDIVEGIRYLHSLGLVHRDIKMKNVLLDSRDRAALSDLGFCAAEALISGSVVGTPVHMAPELLAGEYDATVDVYAFGILFWYVCAGNIKLPSAFEMFQNKEQLWSKVKKGLRPERLPQFSDECWDIMTSCWDTDPARRALLGDVQDRLADVLQRARPEEHSTVDYRPGSDCELSDDDSLYMTSIDRNGVLRA